MTPEPKSGNKMHNIRLADDTWTDLRITKIQSGLSHDDLIKIMLKLYKEATQ